MSQYIEVDYGMALELGVSQGCYVLAEESVGLLQAENAALKEQVSQQDRQLKEMSEALRLKDDASRETLESIENGDCQTARKVLEVSIAIPAFSNGLQNTIAQQAAHIEALRESLSVAADVHALAHVVRNKAIKALTIQPNPDILRERDARLVERINRHLLDIGDNCSDDPLQHIANQIRNGEINV